MDIMVFFGESVFLEDVARCDLVLVGNSSSHLSVFRYGVFIVYVWGLDMVLYDFYRFLFLGIVLVFEEVEAIELVDVVRFY